MSVERAEYVAIFAEGKPFAFENAREAVEKAGFSYKGMALVARGQVISVKREEGRIEWLLKDLKANMTLRLIGKNEDEVFKRFVEFASNGTPVDSVQIQGLVVDSSEAHKVAGQIGAQITLMLTGFEPVENAVLPPLMPKKLKKKTKKDDGWF